MKLRTGFVSNSSVSSFLVCVKDITDLQKSILLENYFRYVDSDEVETALYPFNDTWDPKKITPYLMKCIICNQDITLEFLIEELNIKFTATIEYDSYILAYNPDTEIIAKSFDINSIKAKDLLNMIDIDTKEKKKDFFLSNLKANNDIVTISKSEFLLVNIND